MESETKITFGERISVVSESQYEMNKRLSTNAHRIDNFDSVISVRYVLDARYKLHQQVPGAHYGTPLQGRVEHVF